MSRGIKHLQIDFGTQTDDGQVSAEHMPIKDVGGHYTVDNVEAALQEVGDGGGGDDEARRYAFFY